MVQSLERAFAILAAVAERPAGVSALATQLELPKSTVARLLSSLAALGAVVRVDGRRWQVGPGLEALVGSVPLERSLTARARPELTRLVDALGEDAGLGLPDGHEVLYVAQVPCDHQVQVRDWTGSRAPLHAVPSGLVLLADWPDDAVAAFAADGLAALTPQTVIDPEQLLARLEDVARSGYAWGLEEYADGINSIAAPVRDTHGHVVAAIHVHGPAYRFPQRGSEERTTDEVVAAARAVSRALARDEG
jgi:DNA-binding IclR family transcriptional regulator